jgi:hypothetical protein
MHLLWATSRSKSKSDAKSTRNIQAVEAESTVRLPQRDSPYKNKESRVSRFGVWVALASLALLIAVFLFFRKTGNPKTAAVTSNIAVSESATPHDSASEAPLPVPPSRTPRNRKPAPLGAAALACPANPRSIQNEARLQPDEGTNGHGTLTVDNGTADDATVQLVNTNNDHISRYAYALAHHKLTLKGIEVGDYQLLFSLGTNWTGDDFTCSPGYSEFDKSLVYSESVVGNRHEFHEMSVTLHPVADGNVKTRTISSADFHRRTQSRGNSHN